MQMHGRRLATLSWFVQRLSTANSVAELALSWLCIVTAQLCGGMPLRSASERRLGEISGRSWSGLI